MAKGLYAAKKILKEKKKYLKKKGTRYSKKAEKSCMVSALVIKKVHDNLIQQKENVSKFNL